MKASPSNRSGNSPPTDPSGAGGFTLFEVLVALGIFCLAIIGLLFACNSALDAAREVRFEAAVRRLLEDRVAELEGMDAGDYAQAFDSALPGVAIHESISRETVVDHERTILEGFWKVAVQARWVRDGEERSLEAEFLRYEP